MLAGGLPALPVPVMAEHRAGVPETKVGEPDAVGIGLPKEAPAFRWIVSTRLLHSEESRLRLKESRGTWLGSGILLS